MPLLYKHGVCITPASADGGGAGRLQYNASESRYMKNDAHTNLGRLACGADHYGVHGISHKCLTAVGAHPLFFLVRANSLSDAGGSALKRIIAGLGVHI